MSEQLARPSTLRSRLFGSFGKTALRPPIIDRSSEDRAALRQMFASLDHQEKAHSITAEALLMICAVKDSYDAKRATGSLTTNNNRYYVATPRQLIDVRNYEPVFEPTEDYSLYKNVCLAYELEGLVSDAVPMLTSNTFVTSQKDPLPLTIPMTSSNLTSKPESTLTNLHEVLLAISAKPLPKRI